MPFADREKRREYNKKYYELNKEKIGECNKKHRKNWRSCSYFGSRCHRYQKTNQRQNNDKY